MPRNHTAHAGRDPRGPCHYPQTGFSLTGERFAYLADEVTEEEIDAGLITREKARAFERRLAFLAANKHESWERGTLVLIALRYAIEVPQDIVDLAVTLHDWAHETHGICLGGEHTDEKEHVMREGLALLTGGDAPAA